MKFLGIHTDGHLGGQTLLVLGYEFGSLLSRTECEQAAAAIEAKVDCAKFKVALVPVCDRFYGCCCHPDACLRESGE